MLKIVPKDAAEYGFKDPIPFYVMLFSSLARFESDFDPKETYTENFTDAKGKKVLSRGLFQVSIESANQKAYNCGIKNAEDLHDPYTNMRVAVTIANYWIVRDGSIAGGIRGAWRGMARYWHPFRNPEGVAAIKKNTRSL